MRGTDAAVTLARDAQMTVAAALVRHAGAETAFSRSTTASVAAGETEDGVGTGDALASEESGVAP